MRLTLLLVILAGFAALAPMSAPAQTAPRYHNPSASSVVAPRYTSPPVADEYRAPLWEFRHFPQGIPKAGEHAYYYRYYPYAPYRSTYPQDRYDRNKSQRYPVR